MRTVVAFVIGVPAVFLLSLYAAFLSGEWLGWMVGDDTGATSGMFGVFAFFVYAAALGTGLFCTWASIGKKD